MHWNIRVLLASRLAASVPKEFLGDSVDKSTVPFPVLKKKGGGGNQSKLWPLLIIE